MINLEAKTKVVAGVTYTLCPFDYELPTKQDADNARMWIIIAKLHEQDEIWTEYNNSYLMLSFNPFQIIFMDSLGKKHVYSIQNSGWIV